MEFLGFIGIIIVILIITVLVGNQRDKNRGTGYYENYGPNSTRRQRNQIEHGRAEVRRGLQLYLQNREEEARECWRRAEEIGEVEAITCLGIDAFEQDKFPVAQHRWGQAAGRGEPVSQMLLRLIAKPRSSARDDDIYNIYTSFGLFEAEGEVESGWMLAAYAKTYGLHSYTDSLMRRIRDIENHQQQSKRHGWTL